MISTCESVDRFIKADSTISLAHELGLAVVAEGIEDQATWDLLARLRCDTAQGYWISRPLPVDVFEQWVAESGWSLSGGDTHRRAA